MLISEMTLRNEDSIDGKITGASDIGSNLSGHDFFPLVVGIEIVSANNVITPAIISVGTNSPNFDNIATGLVVGGAAGGITSALLSGAQKVPTSTTVKANVTSGAVATELSFAVHLSGSRF